jgi:nitrogen fixation protein
MKDSLISQLDAALVAASKDIRLLRRLSWGGNVEQVFLDGWRKGRPALPDATQQPQPLDSTVEALEAIDQDDVVWVNVGLSFAY